MIASTALSPTRGDISAPARSCTSEQGISSTQAARHGHRRRSRATSVDGATGICWDNAGVESLWSTFKHEYYYRHTFTTKTELIAAVDAWIHRYNTAAGTQRSARSAPSTTR